MNVFYTCVNIENIGNYIEINHLINWFLEILWSCIGLMYVWCLQGRWFSRLGVDSRIYMQPQQQVRCWFLDFDAASAAGVIHQYARLRFPPSRPSSSCPALSCDLTSTPGRKDGWMDGWISDVASLHPLPVSLAPSHISWSGLHPYSTSPPPPPQNPGTPCLSLCLSSLLIHLSSLTLMLLLLDKFAKTRWCENFKKWLKPWHIGTHLKVLSKSYWINTNMAGFGRFLKLFVFLWLGGK